MEDAPEATNGNEAATLFSYEGFAGQTNYAHKIRTEIMRKRTISMSQNLLSGLSFFRTDSQYSPPQPEFFHSQSLQLQLQAITSQGRMPWTGSPYFDKSGSLATVSKKRSMLLSKHLNLCHVFARADQETEQTLANSETAFPLERPASCSFTRFFECVYCI